MINDKILENAIIDLNNEEIYGKTIIDKPNITIKNGTLVYDLYHAKEIDGKKVGTTGSASVLITKEALNFKAYNVTFKNSFEDLNTKSRQAVAIKCMADNAYFKDCKFLSYQDTLYLDEAKNIIIEDSIIKGDIDFIFGSAEVTFNNCLIETKRSNSLYFMAPNTKKEYSSGFKFNNCTFINDNEEVCYLGRPWYPSGANFLIYPQIEINDFKFIGNIKLELVKMEKSTRDDYKLIINNSTINDKLINIKIVK